MELRRTKMLATIGPASDSPEMLRSLFQNGVTACRLNFSHGTHSDHAARIAKIRQVADEMGIAVPIVMDLCGPKVRTDTKSYELKAGETWTLVPPKVTLPRTRSASAIPACTSWSLPGSRSFWTTATWS